jgi:hypothetical protein
VRPADPDPRRARQQGRTILVSSHILAEVSQTVDLTYLAAPDRNRVLVAKSIAGAIAGFAYGIIAALVATASALIFVAAHHDHVTLGAGTFAAHILGAGLGAALLAAMGVAVGSRSPGSSASSSGARSSK